MAGRAWSDEHVHQRHPDVQVVARVSPHLGPTEWLPEGADLHHPPPPSRRVRLGRRLGVAGLLTVLAALWVLDPDLPDRPDAGPTAGGTGARPVRVTGGRDSDAGELARAVHRPRRRVRQWLVLTATSLRLEVQQRPRWVHRSRPDELVSRWTAPRSTVSTTWDVGLVLVLGDGSAVKIPNADAAHLRTALGST